MLRKYRGKRCVKTKGRDIYSSVPSPYGNAPYNFLEINSLYTTENIDIRTYEHFAKWVINGEHIIFHPIDQNIISERQVLLSPQLKYLGC